ncbi:Uncharacterised protein [Salmonella enterica subsp. enterica serovar Daytona]|uniref:Uncharacterized protein n=1 Tax=Salmonella enterica subsp. enterica serovar Daytona TaxID=1962639 RepID=A0A447JFS3_SALET|nr:Uncharacterised protein [Salmonella enterica subsp. enterica serovar Daytona]
MRVAKIGVIALFLLDGYWRYRRRDAGRLQFYFACRVSARVSLSNRRSIMIAASATSSAPWIT